MKINGIILLSFRNHTSLTTGASDGGVHAYDIASSPSRDGRPVRSLSGHAAGVLSVDLSTCSGSLASGSEDGTVRNHLFPLEI